MIPIIPFIFYHGKKKLSIPENFSNYFNIEDKNIKEYLLNFKSIIFDTNRLNDDKIIETTKAINNLELLAGLLSMKHIFDDIKSLKPVLKALIQVSDKNGYCLFLEYIIIARDIDKKELSRVIKETGGDKMPTLADRLIEEGKQIGWQEGKQAGWQEGVYEGLLEAIKIGLQLKFSSDGLALFESIKTINDIDKLKTIKDAIIDAKSVDEIKKLLINN